MHEAKMLKQQGKKISQIAEALGKSERMIHYYLSEYKLVHPIKYMQNLNLSQPVINFRKYPE